MKRIVISLFIFIFTICIFANDFMQPVQIAIDNQHRVTLGGTRTGHREQDPAPDYSFILNGNGDPTTFLIHSYYDYMPYSYNGHNVRLQPEISMPYGYTAGGIYITYMRSETQNVGIDRRAYFSYINSDGTLCESNSINNAIDREGFTSCAVDPYTADPFAVWHAVTEPDGSYDSYLSYYLYHATGGPSWRQPIIVIDNPEMSEPLTGHYDDEFIWPQVHIGPSPIPEHRRVHVYGNNYTNNTSGNTNYNIFYMYADFDDTDLLSNSDLDWTAQSFPYFDDMHYNNIARVNKDMIVSNVDGKVVFFGNVADSLFALYSDDYGETFTKHTRQLLQQLPNLINIHTGLPMFEDDWFALPTNDLTHYNGIFTDDNTKVQWMSGVNYNSQENINNGYWLPQFIYPKIFTFDTETGEFNFYDLDIQDTDPGDDQLAVAYDLNNDGEIDEYIDQMPYIPVSYPVWCFDGMYHYGDESNCKMTSNENWIVCVWHDSAKLYQAYYGEPGYDGWVEQPEIAIVISDDNGETWSDIRYINANPNDNIIDPANHYDGNYAPEFEGMLPVDITLGDKLEIISNDPGNYHAKLHFAFMDDEIYGSSTPGSGGNLQYAAIDLEFQEAWIDPVSVDPEIVPVANIQLYNYPNPFNPTTTISFETSNLNENTQIEIYNIKGQKVKTLPVNLSGVEGGERGSVIWNGKDSNNKQVSSGIYFYKLQSGDLQDVKKMMLLK